MITKGTLAGKKAKYKSFDLHLNCLIIRWLKRREKCLLCRKFSAMTKASMNNYEFITLFLQLLQFFEINEMILKRLTGSKDGTQTP